MSSRSVESATQPAQADLREIFNQRDQLGLAAKEIIIRELNASLDTLPVYDAFYCGFNIAGGTPGIVLDHGGYSWGTYRYNPTIVLDRQGISEIPWESNEGRSAHLNHKKKTEIPPSKYLDMAVRALDEINSWSKKRNKTV